MITFISQSMLNQWLRCGEQFRRRWMEGEIIPPGIAARTGSAIHKAADIHNKARIVDGLGFPLDMLQDAARDEYMRLVKDEGVFITSDEAPEAKKLLGEGLDKAVGGTKVWLEQCAPLYQPLESEVRLSKDIGIGIPVMGTLDTQTGPRKIRDLKNHGKTKSQAWADSEIQPTMYALLLDQGEDEIEFTYDQIVNGSKEIKHVETVTTRDKRDYQVLFRIIEVFMKDLQGGMWRPAEPGHWICSQKWCGFFRSCRFARGWKQIAA